MSALSESSLKRSDKAIIDIHQTSSTLPSRNRKPVQQLDHLVDIAIGNNHVELATTSAHARNDDGRAASYTSSSSYQTRVRDTVRVGDVVTTEVPGLAEALRRPGVAVEVDIVLTDGSPISASVLIADAASTLGLKAWARTVRQESRDAEDLWRCLEIALADGVDRQMLDPDAALASEHSSPRLLASLARLDDINSLTLDPAVEFALVEANELPDLEVVDSPLGDEATDEARIDVEVLGSPTDVEKGHTAGRRTIDAERDMRCCVLCWLTNSAASTPPLLP